MALITQAEYARRKGVTRQAIYEAVKAGRIVLVNGKIDPDYADVKLQQTTTQPKAAYNGVLKPAVTKAAPVLPTEPAPSPDPADPLPDTAITQTVYDLQLSRAKREHHEANIAEMRERQKAGELVELADVHLAYTTLAAQLRSALERIPDKLAPRLTAETDEHTVHALMLAELDQALMDMAQTAEQLPAKLQETARHE